MVDETTLRGALSHTLAETHLDSLGRKYEGKVRDNYTTKDGRRFIVVTDRISAFDRVLGTIPFKGQVLNRLAAWWFEKTKGVAKNHVIRVPDPNVLECVECTPVLVEMVVRAYATGTTSTSLWTHYEKGERVFCGHRLPEGLTKHQKLPAPILTPTTKAPKGEHDVSGSREEILATGLVTAKDFDEAAEMAMRLFAEGQKTCAARGLILVDTKYELGRTKDGALVVIDEIHTPDSSRFWRASTYDERIAKGEDPEALDKDFVRRHFISVGYKGDGPAPPIPDDVRVGAAQRYIEAYEQITGETFTPDTEPPVERLRRNLGGLSVKATIKVRLKTEVLDPQGDAVRRALAKLGFEGVKDVRVGKIVEIELDDAGTADKAELRKRLVKMSDEMLANPVIEDFEVEL